MKIRNSLILILLAIVCAPVHGQEPQQPDSIPHSGQVVFDSHIDPLWQTWKLKSYNYGINTSLVAVPIRFNASILTDGMVMVRGNTTDKRWGYHCFEAYAENDRSRLTMLLNKHIELGMPVAEIYYFGADYSIGANGYNWMRIGSDVKKHSYLFSRDRAIFYGSLQLSNALTLGNIGSDDILTEHPRGNGEDNCEGESKFINYTQLSQSGNGTMFYDKDNNIVVIKVDGQWMQVKVAPLPKGVEYPF